jgi:sialidase-1
MIAPKTNNQNTLARSQTGTRICPAMKYPSLQRVMFCLVAVAITCCRLSADEERRSTQLETHPKTRQLPSDLLGPFVQLADGRLLTVDQGAALISANGGKTWTEKHDIAPAQDPYCKALKISPERALCRLRDGAIVLAFMNINEQVFEWKEQKSDTEPGARLPTYAVRSLDDGKTWRDLQMLHEDYTGAIRDMIQTKNGTVVFTSMQLKHDPGRHTVVTYASKDSGKTWIRSNIIDLGGTGHHGGVTEATLEQLVNGRLWMLMRSNWGRFWECFSEDDGVSWRVIQPSKIEASSAPGLVKRLHSGKLVLFWNRPWPEGSSTYPLTGGDNQWSEVPVSSHRGELSMAFSSDDGKSWTKPVVVARQPGKWLAYPYFFEPEPGLIWLTTMQGDVRLSLRESDFDP